MIMSSYFFTNGVSMPTAIIYHRLTIYVDGHVRPMLAVPTTDGTIYADGSVPLSTA
jgi:hypothetical protein